MVDTRTKEERSRIMAAVHSKDTTPEILVRKFLWSHGIRYRLHPKNLPGKPDIVIPKWRIAIFIHGCFWHGHEECSLGRLPKSRVEYWSEKIEKNKQRDFFVKNKLEAEGWRVLIAWNCQLRTRKAAITFLSEFLDEIKRFSSSL